jgi:hypothetical protein
MMAKLIFYRQQRFDGAVRTGVELDGETIAERFEGGGVDSDPVLLWYIDLRCDGQGIPDDPNAAAQWLLDQSELIRDGFVRFAEKLRVGADLDLYSLTWSDFRDPPPEVRMMIACSAARRVDAREMSGKLIDVGENWDAIIRALDIPQEVEDLR